MRDNPIQFAVVREDPDIERRAMGGVPARVLLIGSGGCTALALQGHWPDTEFSLVDPNAAQLDLIRSKVHALQSGDSSSLQTRFNVGSIDADGLSQCGNFESLFRALRRFLEEFVVEEEEIRSWFVAPVGGDGGRNDGLRRVFARTYWPVAFELHFSDALLNAMFGVAATQHAPAGSYPDYFRERLEEGLCRPDASHNYFLHHIFLGAYLPQALPPFLVRPATEYHFDYIGDTLANVPGLDTYDLVDLSNIMDWMDTTESAAIAARLCEQMRPGATVLWRQLNNARNYLPWFEPAFGFDPKRDAELSLAERSLFYSSVHVGVKETGHG